MDTVITALRALLLTALGSTYKDYYYGENLVPAQADFPFLEIVPVSTLMEQRGTNSMMNEFTIMINIKDTLKNFLTSDTDKEILSHMQTMVKRMEERETSPDGKPKAATVLGVLHDNRQMSNTVHINNDFEIAYNVTEYGESWLLKASLTFTASKISMRS